MRHYYGDKISLQLICPLKGETEKWR